MLPERREGLRGALRARRLVAQGQAEGIEAKGVRGEAQAAALARPGSLRRPGRREGALDPRTGFRQPEIQTPDDQGAADCGRISVAARLAQRIPREISSARATAVSKIAPGSSTAGKPISAAV